MLPATTALSKRALCRIIERVVVTLPRAGTPYIEAGVYYKQVNIPKRWSDV